MDSAVEELSLLIRLSSDAVMYAYEMLIAYDEFSFVPKLNSISFPLPFFMSLLRTLLPAALAETVAGVFSVSVTRYLYPTVEFTYTERDVFELFGSILYVGASAEDGDAAATVYLSFHTVTQSEFALFFACTKIS